MTDRRKTFDTPLDALRWLLEEPSKRAVKNKHGFRFFVRINFNGYIERLTSQANGSCERTGVPLLDDCPLTAVEDEHGVIEEEKPKVASFETREEFAASIEWAHKCDKEEARRSYGRHAYDQIVKLIREEIAAATVETDVGRTGRWEEQDDLRLKPQG